MNQFNSLLSLASNIAGEQFLNKQQPGIWMVTGPRGIGKTRFCKTLYAKLDHLYLSLGGVISNARMENGHKTGIFLRNLITGQQQLLGTRGTSDGFAVQVGWWYFNPEVLRWGNECLKAAAGSDVVIFDECGFLELEHGEGLQFGLKLFDDRDFKLGIVVVRPSLLSIAQKRWPEAVVINLDEELL
ncbi:MAG: nucleoside-triphosphatase [Anaerolineales bacterium]